MSKGTAEGAIIEIAKKSGLFSLQCTDVAGAVNEVSALMTTQAEAVGDLRTASSEMNERRSDVAQATVSIAQALSQIESAANQSGEAVNNTSEHTGELAVTVSGLESRIEGLSKALETVSQVSTTINAIARQTSLLALNATIEAARAGDAGRGFSVVANEVKKLSTETREATERIQTVMEELGEETEGLITDIRAGASQAENAKEKMGELIGSIEQMSYAISVASGCNQQVESAGSSMSLACERVDGLLVQVADGMVLAANNLQNADKQLSELATFGEQLVRITATAGVETPDTHFIKLAQQSANEIGAMFEKAIKDFDTTEAALFDREYIPIPNTKPQQVMTKFTDLTDKLLVNLQEAVLEKTPGVAFCAAVDDNGYLPTHNLKFSHPQRPNDPVWNAANCRNRRIFNDPVGLMAGQNTEPFALQTYRRDMGGGQFVMMKDISAPIVVNGRHWGGFRIGVVADT